MNGRETAAPLSASLLLDGEDRILEGNRDAEAFLERPLEEVRKARLYEANPVLYSALKEMLAKSKRGRGVEDYALAYKVGKRLMRLSVSITPYPLEALGTTGSLITISAFGARPAADKREPKKEEAAAAPPAEEVEGLYGFLGTLSDPVFILDMEANFVYVNPAMCFLLGHPRDEIIGRPLSFFLRREEAKASLDGLVEAARSAPWRGELEFARKDGGSCLISATVEVMKRGRGKASQLLGMGRDSTAEARIRREREEEVMRVWSLLERSGLALACFTPDLRVTLLSQRAEELLAVTSDRAIGARLPELFPAHARDEVGSLLERSLREEVAGAEVRLAGEKEGERVFALDVRPAVLEKGQPREYMMVLREATEELSQRQRNEELLREAGLRVSLLEAAVGKSDVGELLGEQLDLLAREFGYAAAAAYVVDKRQARLAASRGLSREALEALRELRLRPGYARQCAGMEELRVELHGGVPRKGWKEVHSLVDKADSLLPLLREERWKNLLILPLRGEEVNGSLAFADCDEESTGRFGGRLLRATASAVASVLAALASLAETREEAAGAGEEAEAGVETADAPPAALRREGLEVEEGRPAGEEAAEPGETASGAEEAAEPWEEAARGAHEGGAREAEAEADAAEASEAMDDAEAKRNRTEKRRRGLTEREHDYFEIAREARRDEEALDHLALWSDREPEIATPSPRGVDLSSLLWELKQMFAWGQRKDEIFLELEEDLPKVHTDRRLLREALAQLLDNALRYSPPGAPVVLGAERWGDEVLLRVEDQGPGIPHEVVDRVMRGEPEREGGEGPVPAEKAPGLVLCRRYVEAMKGSLSIKAKLGEGTTAFVRLRVLPFVGESP